MCWRETEGETGEWSGYTGEWSGHSICITWSLNRGYPALLPMIKSWDMLPNSMESHELGIKIKESVSASLLLYTNSFHSYKDSNTMAYWHSEFNCLQVYLLSLESGPASWISTSLPPSEDLDASSSSLALIMNLSIVLSFYILFFHSFYISPDSSLLVCHSSKILLCQLLYISALKCNIFCSYSAVHRTPDFFYGV